MIEASLPAVFGAGRAPEAFHRAREAWVYPREPEGSVVPPHGIPKCGQRAGSSGNPAMMFLTNHGWPTVTWLAKRGNVKESALRREIRRGKIPYLRVGFRSMFIPREAVDAVLREFGDAGSHEEWVRAGRPLPLTNAAIYRERRRRCRAEGAGSSSSSSSS